MSFKEIKNKLEKIYQERKKWNCARGPFNKHTIAKKEAVIIKQVMLENYLMQRQLVKKIVEYDI